MPVLLIEKREACGTCGSCCYYFTNVEVEERDLVEHGTPAELTTVVNGARRMRRRPAASPGRDECATVCVGYDEEARRCTIYEQRPETCREFRLNGEKCVLASIRYGEAHVAGKVTPL